MKISSLSTKLSSLRSPQALRLRVTEAGRQRSSRSFMSKLLINGIYADVRRTQSLRYRTQATGVQQSINDTNDFTSDERPVILYDGVCNLCNGAVNLMIDLDPNGKSFRMAALQSNAGKRLLKRCGRSSDDISSIVVVEKDGIHHIKSEAVLQIARRLQNPFPLLAIFGLPVPLFVRDVVYDMVANNRYSILGQRTECRLSDESCADRFLSE